MPITTFANYLPQAEVSRDGAPLRLEARPDRAASALLRGGSKVSIETRLDDWYRIVTPAGTRGWINSDDLVFAARGKNTISGMLVRVKGYDASIDGEGF